MNALVSTMLFVSVLFPQKGWFTPDQPININVKPHGEISLFLTDFGGRAIETRGSTEVKGEQTSADGLGAHRMNAAGAAALEDQC